MGFGKCINWNTGIKNGWAGSGLHRLGYHKKRCWNFGRGVAFDQHGGGGVNWYCRRLAQSKFNLFQFIMNRLCDCQSRPVMRLMFSARQGESAPITDEAY